MGHDGEKECYAELSENPNCVTPDTPWPRKSNVVNQSATLPKEEQQETGPFAMPSPTPKEIEVGLIRVATTLVMSDHSCNNTCKELITAAREFLIRKFNADKPMTEDQLRELEKLADSLPKGL